VDTTKGHYLYDIAYSLATIYGYSYSIVYNAMSGERTTHCGARPLIYLVDDEEMMLNLAEVSLLGDGYALKKFQDPQAALESFTSESSKPSLLLTDFAMLPMNGLELSARCKSSHPALKILLVSGTAGPEVVHTSPVDVDQFIAKPYAPADLARVVRSLLEE
jgi:CheY-like chemotaxis protein